MRMPQTGMKRCLLQDHLIAHKTFQSSHITLFRSITMLHGTDNIMQNIPHIHSECGEYYVDYCQSLVEIK